MNEYKTLWVREQYLLFPMFSKDVHTHKSKSLFGKELSSSDNKFNIDYQEILVSWYFQLGEIINLNSLTLTLHQTITGFQDPEV